MKMNIVAFADRPRVIKRLMLHY